MYCRCSFRVEVAFVECWFKNMFELDCKISIWRVLCALSNICKLVYCQQLPDGGEAARPTAAIRRWNSRKSFSSTPT